jgi:hypothetical protein
MKETPVFQLRIYTLTSSEALRRYADVHWARHVSTFARFGVTTRAVWTEWGSSPTQLIAVVQYPPDTNPDTNPDTLTQRIMGSPEFASDMDGFDVSDIVDVQTTLLEPTSFSPIH